jgi:excisionase family DNA binding protein
MPRPRVGGFNQRSPDSPEGLDLRELTERTVRDACTLQGFAPPSGRRGSRCRSRATTRDGALTMHSERLAYSVEEVCDLTGLSRSLVYDLMAAGRLAYIKAGRRRIITAQHLAAFLDSAERVA